MINTEGAVDQPRASLPILPEPGAFRVMSWGDASPQPYLTTAVSVRAQTATDLGWLLVTRQPLEMALQPISRLHTLLARHPDTPPGQLELEVLETAALDDIAYVSALMERCRALGVMFALDDFGTGYSSLTYLKRLPADWLKIDQSFVRDMLDDLDDLSILEGVLGMSRAFQRQAIAEGVETLAHGEMLLRLGCELAQGYAIARPMPADAVLHWLRTWRPDPSWLNQTPISRDDLPMLFASVEHRVWVNKVVSFVQGEGTAPPPMHHEQCRVGQWMKTEACLRAEKRPGFQALGPLHVQVHELAAELVGLTQAGQTDAAMARVTELYSLRDRLLALFAALLRQGGRGQGRVNGTAAATFRLLSCELAVCHCEMTRLCA